MHGVRYLGLNTGRSIPVNLLPKLCLDKNIKNSGKFKKKKEKKNDKSWTDDRD